MAKTWSSHGPSNWFFLNPQHVPRDVPCQISHFWMYLVAPSPRNDQKRALLWPKHGPHNVLQIGSFQILIIVPRDVPCQISHCWDYPVAPFPKNGQSIALLWQKHGPHMVLQIVFLNHSQYAQGCSMPNFTILGLSHCPLFLEMAKILPKYGPFMAKTWSFKLVLPES